jgi:hypothetical protein
MENFANTFHFTYRILQFGAVAKRIIVIRWLAAMKMKLKWKFLPEESGE